MIEHLQIGRSAHFYGSRRNISAAALDTLFRDLRRAKGATAQNLFRLRKVGHAGATFSAICFPYERVPSFLDDEAGVEETVFGFLMLVEKGDLVAVHKSGLDLTSGFKTRYLGRMDDQRIERAIARHDAVFEKLALRNMSVSKLALRSKSLEARDLASAISSSNASRFVPQRYSLRRDDGSYSATPSTGRISNRADRAGHLEVLDWTIGILDAIAADVGEVSDFIRSFARQLNLEQLGANVRPTYVAVDVPALTDLLFGDQVELRLVRQEGESFTELTKEEVEALLADLDRSFPVRRRRSSLELTDLADEGKLATLKISKSRISLAGFAPPGAANVIVERREFALGMDLDRRPLARHVDREQLFTVLFNDLSLAYLNGNLYKDEALLGGGANFLRRFVVCPELVDATSEKGDFANAQVEFTQGSVFRTVIDQVAVDDDVLVCDDLGDEWADFIGMRTAADPVTVSFYHAKHGSRSLSASAFHEAVGQAIKNLGRLTLPIDRMVAKLGSWDEPYRNDGVETAINRVVRGGDAGQIVACIDDMRGAPDLMKRVLIVTSSLSRADVANEFQRIEGGGAPRAHFVQLYWLLTSYFTACAEVGAVGYVVCRP